MSAGRSESLRLALTPKTTQIVMKVAVSIEHMKRPGIMVQLGTLRMSREHLSRLRECLTLGAERANIALSIGPVPEPPRARTSPPRKPTPPKSSSKLSPKPPRQPQPGATDQEREHWSRFFGRELEADEPML